MRGNHKPIWNAASHAQLITLWYQVPRLSCTEIAKIMGLKSRNAVIGKVHRLNLKRRRNPIFQRMYLLTPAEVQRHRDNRMKRQAEKMAKLKVEKSYEDKLEELRKILWNKEWQREDANLTRFINQLTVRRQERKLAAWEHASKDQDWLKHELQESGPQYSSGQKQAPVYL